MSRRLYGEILQTRIGATGKDESQFSAKKKSYDLNIEYLKRTNRSSNGIFYKLKSSLQKKIQVGSDVCIMRRSKTKFSKKKFGMHKASYLALIQNIRTNHEVVEIQELGEEHL
jgi:type IV secretory pathway VirB4 component